MGKATKQLSNPYSTGSGGAHFEERVQASFVVLMLTDGFVPCLPRYPIRKIKLQGKYAGFETDDLVVFTKNKDGDERKLLGQMKHQITISENDQVFGEVIKGAWKDFNNDNLFTKGKDVIALITGPLSTTDTYDVRTILELARHSENANEFFQKVELKNFCSEQKRKKLKAFETQLQKSNNDNPLEKDIFFEFLKSFHLIGYDLDIKAGLNLSLLYSLMSKYSQENIENLWAKIVYDIGEYNQTAGTISRKNMPEEWKEAFTLQIPSVIPSELSLTKPEPSAIEWDKKDFADDLAIANLIGSWSESNEADIALISSLVKNDYSSWITSIRKTLHDSSVSVTLNNGVWRIKKRKELWESLGSRIHNDSLDLFQELAVNVLSERNPKFDLKINERHGAAIYGKVPKYSNEIRKGLVETLALLGNKAKYLTHCSLHKPETTAVLAVRKILEDADWKLWGSLNNLLPILAEAAPDEYLNAIETHLQRSPSPITELFSEEGDALYGGTYSMGIRWSLETLAWEEQYLVRVCIALARISSSDGGSKSNANFEDSIATILLPWLPQTTASIDKRKVSVNTLLKEFPEVAWRILFVLLPGKHQTSHGTHKPSWRDSIPVEWDKKVSQKDYLKQCSYFAKILVSMALDDIDKITELVSNLNNIPQPSFDKVLEYLSSNEIMQKPEEQRLMVWRKLVGFTSDHRRFSEADWTLNSETVSRIEEIAAKLAPANPLNLHKRLFDNGAWHLFGKLGSWEETDKIVQKHRKKALKEILNYGGMDAIIQFSESVDNSNDIGHLLSVMEYDEAEVALLPRCLDPDKTVLVNLARGYVYNRQYRHKWEWVDKFAQTKWSIAQKAQFLAFLPFTKETWNRAEKWLGGSEKEYWIRTNTFNPDDNEDIGSGIDKLIKYGRPEAAIQLLSDKLHRKQYLDKSRSIKSLFALLAPHEEIDPPSSMTRHNIHSLIQALQNDPDTSFDELYELEWSYLSILDRYSAAMPQSLEKGLASDPSFFCEILRMLYRSEKDAKSDREPSEQEKANASNAWKLFGNWRIPPGMQEDGSFSEEQFSKWLEDVKEKSAESGHLDRALYRIGEVLFYCPSEPDGLWINQTVAEALNNLDAENMREGFYIRVHNSRGAHTVDPTGKPERELAQQYRKKADDIENAGYYRFAITLRDVAESYDNHAERIITRHKAELEEDQNDEDE